MKKTAASETASKPMKTEDKTVIRKYGDRRLYDTSAKRYVKLEDIKRMVRDGVEVQVLEARTNKDLTRVVLTQIIVEDSRDKESGPPLQLLRQIVMISDKATHEFLASYLNSAMELVKKAQEGVASRISGARSVVATPLDYVRQFLGAPPDEEIEELRRRVRELEDRLAERSRPTKPKRKDRSARKAPAN